MSPDTKPGYNMIQGDKGESVFVSIPIVLERIVVNENPAASVDHGTSRV